MSLFISERRRKQTPRLSMALKVMILFMLLVALVVGYLLM